MPDLVLPQKSSRESDERHPPGRAQYQRAGDEGAATDLALDR